MGSIDSVDISSARVQFRYEAVGDTQSKVRPYFNDVQYECKPES